ncbi:MAG: hypothetical protein QW638_03295 [Candidatus Bathyarchaeia archaeon]
MIAERLWGDFKVAEDICIGGSWIYVVGWRFDTNRQKNEAGLAKFDIDGNLIWNITWTDGIEAFARSICCSNDSVYVLGTKKNETYST